MNKKTTGRLVAAGAGVAVLAGFIVWNVVWMNSTVERYNAEELPGKEMQAKLGEPGNGDARKVRDEQRAQPGDSLDRPDSAAYPGQVGLQEDSGSGSDSPGISETAAKKKAEPEKMPVRTINPQAAPSVNLKEAERTAPNHGQQDGVYNTGRDHADTETPAAPVGEETQRITVQDNTISVSIKNRKKSSGRGSGRRVFTPIQNNPSPRASSQSAYTIVTKPAAQHPTSTVP